MHSRSAAWGSVVPLAALLLLALVAAGSLWGPGLLNTRGGGDSPFLLLRTHQLAANLQAGVFPARWMPDAAYGLGYPFFSHYAALPYYLAAGFTLIGLDILSAIKLTQTLFLAAAALGMYGWARRALHSRAGGWLAAFAYTLAPFHLVNVYVRGDSLSEFAAFAFYPLILWGLDHLAARPSLRRAVLPALAYAGLILTHNSSALIFSPFILLYLVILVWRDWKQRRRFLAFGIWALGLGISLSAWFWLPALAETDYVQLTAQTSGYFFYGNHFRGVDLVQPIFIFDYAITPGGTTPFAMGLVQAALALAGGIVVIAGWTRRYSPHPSPQPPPLSQNGKRGGGNPVGVGGEMRAFALIGLLLSTWLITPLSRPLWDHIPLLAMVQFPWRFLSVQALFTALLTGALVPLTSPPMGGKEGGRGWIAAIVLAGLLTVAGLAGLRPEYLPITAEEVTAEQLQLYELFTDNIGSTIRYEYLPRWVVPRPHTGPALFDPDAPPQAIPLNRELASAKETAHEPTRRVWTVETDGGDAKVAFPVYYWPGWRATVDGASVKVEPAPDSGYLTLTVPTGRHQVVVWLGRTPLRTIAEGMSLATALALLTVAIASRRKTQSPQPRTPTGPFVSCLVTFVICLALLVVLSPRMTPTDATDLTMDFERMQYLHHNPGGIDLEGLFVTSYRYNTNRLAPGDTLHVTLNGKAEQESASVTLRLVSPAAVRQDELPAVAEATTLWTGDTTLELPIPHDVAPGLYLIRLEGGGEKAKQAYLRPVWVDGGESATGQPTSGTFADDKLRLHTVEATQLAPDQLELRLDWSAARPVAANYGLSLRLTDPAGHEWARLEKQPGYGYLPTSLWPVGRLIHDHYTLPLPEGTPPGDQYTLAVSLYRIATWESVGDFTCPISLPLATLRPEAQVAAHLGDELALSRLKTPDHVRQGETLRMTAYWLAVEQPSADYVAEWQLEATEGHISATLPLAPGSLPTTWPVGAWVTGRALLSIPPTAPPGDYTLSLTLRDPASGVSLGDYAYPRPVRVRERERVWELPPMQQEVGAHFGGMIELAGYDLRQKQDTLRLTLHWRALTTPDQHYMLFIHLADPTTGHPVAQVDTMPREFTYPTGLWATGEVVSDEIVLSLEGAMSGQYDLVIGWYDPKTKIRLEAQDAMDSILPDGRLILSEQVTIP